MKVCDISFDKNRFVFDIVYTAKNTTDITFVITDLDIDCPYYTWDTTLAHNSSIWISPLHPSLISVARSNETFPGFRCKAYVGRRLVQVDEFPFTKNHNQTPVFVTNDFDIVGPSYLDFFYGTLCDNMDFTGTVIDAGANVGFFTLYALQNNADKIYSIEPDVYPFTYLQKNFSTNPKVSVINKALTSDCLGTSFFYYDSSVASSAVSETEPLVRGEVESLSLDTLLAIESHINLIKLDIEGSEFEVLERLNDRQFDKVNQWFIEFHKKSDSIVKRLRDRGYKTEYRNSDSTSDVGFIYATR